MDENTILTFKNNFLDYCANYAKSHPVAEKTKPIWYEAIPERIKTINEKIANDIMDLADKNPDIYNPEEYAYPIIYANGYRCGRNRFGEKYKEKEEKNPFGNFSMLPKFSVDYGGYTFNKVLEPMGLYIEAWSYYQYDVAENKEIITEEEKEKFYNAVSSETEIFIYWNTKNVPGILMEIGRMWGRLSELTGDKGSCVIGAGMLFKYNGQKYRLSTFSPWQGEGSWVPHVGYIKKCLEIIGAGSIHFDYGRMD